MTAFGSRITLHSNPHKKRVGLIPLGAGLVLCWILVLASVTVTVMGAQQNWIGATIVLTSTATFGFCLSLISIGLVRDSYRDYVLELTESEVVLVVIDRLRKRRGTKMILLEDVSYAEYYPYPDSASIIFHTAYTDMEVPLWPMTNQGRDVVDYLDGRGVRVINVQSDDLIPD